MAKVIEKPTTIEAAGTRKSECSKAHSEPNSESIGSGSGDGFEAENCQADVSMHRRPVFPIVLLSQRR